VQLLEGNLAAGALDQVARELRLPLSRVDGVARFDHLFRLSSPAIASPSATVAEEVTGHADLAAAAGAEHVLIEPGPVLDRINAGGLQT
jgi:bidirectional [NiFe] hydrogenase diaphorase subunit